MPQQTLSSKSGNDIDLVEYAHFFPKQEEALKASSRFKFTLYGGSVGSGKSYWLRWAVIYWLMRMSAETGIKGIRAGIFCEDYPALNDRHISKIKYEFPEWLGTYSGQQHEFTLNPKWGGGVIAFRNLDDPSKYLSVEFAIEAVDEINRNNFSTFVELRKRLRWTGIKNVKFLCACNPIGEAWVKNMFVKRLFPTEEREQYEFIYIPALPTENPHLPPEYFKGLESLPERQRKAVLEGDWDAFSESMDEHGYLRLISDNELQHAITDESEHSGYKIIGVDPAAGGDNSAIVLKSVNLQEVLFNQKLNDVMDLCGVVADCYRRHRVAMIVVDKSGVGQGVYDRLKEMGFETRGISFGEKADKDNEFYNLKAELHWKQREWILTGGKLKRDAGFNEFEIVKYKIKDGRVIIQPKEELFRSGLMSPNVVDASVLTQFVSTQSIRNSIQIKGRQGIMSDKILDIWRG